MGVNKIMKQPLFNTAKFKAFQSDNTLIFSAVNLSNSPLKSPGIKLIKLTKIYLHSITLKQSILQLEENFKIPGDQTVPLLNDSEYFESLEISI